MVLEQFYERKVFRNTAGEIIGINIENYSDFNTYSDLIETFAIQNERVTKLPENLFIGNSYWQYQNDVNTLRTINFDYLVFDFNMGKELDIINRKVVYRDKTDGEKQQFLEWKLRDLILGVVFGDKGEFVHTDLDYSKNNFCIFSNFQTNFYRKLEDAFLEEDVMMRFDSKGLVLGIYSELKKVK